MFRPIFTSIILTLLMLTPTHVATAQQPTDPRAYSETGIPRMRMDSATYRLCGGAGGNLGSISDAPVVTFFRLTSQSGPWIFGLGLSNSANTGPPDVRTAIGEFDFLAGYSWMQTIPAYQGLPTHIYYSIASGLAVANYTLQDRVPGMPDPRFPNRPHFQWMTEASSMSPGLPLQFSVMDEFWRYVGIGAVLFYTVSKLEPSYGGAAVLEVRY